MKIIQVFILCFSVAWIVSSTGVAYADICSNEDTNFDIRKADKKSKALVTEAVALINGVVKDPKAVNMQNWYKLSDPDDETELSFFSDSVGNGIDGNVPAPALIQHSKSLTEPSVALQYLRTSLFAFNQRSGIGFPIITITDVSLKDAGSKIIAKGRLDAYGSDEKLMSHPLEIDFDAEFARDDGENHKYCLSFGSVTVSGQEVYGWWYGL